MGRLAKNDIAFLGLGAMAGLVLGTVAGQRLAKKPLSLPTLKGRMGTALITGASSGIGQGYARRLAVLGYDLVLVARREERLKALAEELERQQRIRVEVLAADLADLAGVTRVEQRLRTLNSLTMLVNSAGFGAWRQFVDFDLERQLDMIKVNVVAGVRLTHAALPGMMARGVGVIINVASIGGYFPTSGNVTYGATKSYVKTFSEALQVELEGTGLRIQALCPGLVVTEFHDSPDFEKFKRNKVPKLFWMTAEEVVETSLSALKTGQVVVIPGLYNRLAVGVTSIPLLGKLILSLSGRVIRRQISA